MQYLVSVIADDTVGPATPDEMAAIDVFNDRLQAEGHWVFAGGLAAPSSVGAEAFVAGVSGRPRGAPRTTGDDPRCSTWFP